MIVHGESLNKEDFNILNKISSPSGRIEKIRNKKNLNIFVDYAHTPDAVKNVLSSLRKDCSGNIITVIGCGGKEIKLKDP